MTHRLFASAAVAALSVPGLSAIAGDMSVTDTDQSRFVNTNTFAYDCAGSGGGFDQESYFAPPYELFDSQAHALSTCEGQDAWVEASASQLSDLEPEVLSGSGSAFVLADPSGTIGTAIGTTYYAVTFTVDALSAFTMSGTIEGTSDAVGFTAKADATLTGSVSGVIFEHSLMIFDDVQSETIEHAGLLQPDEAYMLVVRAEAVGDVIHGTGSASATYDFMFFTGCDADLDGSGDVGPVDIAMLLAQWGPAAGGPPDFDGNGMVGPEDLAVLLSSWGPCSMP